MLSTLLRKRIAPLVGAFLLAMTASWSIADTVVAEGFLVTDESNGVVATNQWRTDYSAATNDGFKIAWYITKTENADFPYHYRYTISNAEGGQLLQKSLSHVIIEVSGNFKSSDISTGASPKWYDATSDGNSNPNMPAAIFGIKFEGSLGQYAVIEFDSIKIPVLGNFYAKGGKSNGTWMTAWNTFMDDPNGLRIMRPDSAFSPPPVPLPAAVWCGIALMGTLGLRRVFAK